MSVNPTPQLSKRKAPPKRLLTPYEEQTLKNDIEVVQRAMADKHCQTKSELRQAAARSAAVLENFSVPDTSPEMRDKAHKEMKALEESIKEGMLSYEEMRRCPHGADDHNAKWEVKNKHKIQQWRNRIQLLNKGETPERLQYLTSVERLRPRTSTLSMIDCDIPRKSLYSFGSQEYKDNYEGIDWQRPDERSKAEVLLDDGADEVVQAALPPGERDDVTPRPPTARNFATKAVGKRK